MISPEFGGRGDPLEDLAHVLGLTVSQLIGEARSTSVH